MALHRTQVEWIVVVLQQFAHQPFGVAGCALLQPVLDPVLPGVARERLQCVVEQRIVFQKMPVLGDQKLGTCADVGFDAYTFRGAHRLE